METKIFFNQSPTDNLHYRKLKSRLKELVKTLPESRRYEKVFAVIVLPVIYALIYLSAISFRDNLPLFFILYALLGIVSVLIFLNIIHDAVHNNVFKKRQMNNVVLIIFDLIGGNSYIWKKRHVLLHHNYQNVAGWDSDIEQSGLIKIFKDEKPSLISKNQSWLIFFFYPLYLVNWMLIRDFKDFFLKKRMIKKVCRIPAIEYFKLILFKSIFLFYMVGIPVLLGFNIIAVLAAFFVMLATGSVFALLTLLTPHVNDHSTFPIPDEKGQLGLSWFEHQFKTTNDVSVLNWFTQHIMGNFNFHLAHHLFPNINSVYAPEVTSEIRKYAMENGFQYRSYGLVDALHYHYKLIKANAMAEDFFEEDM